MSSPQRQLRPCLAELLRTCVKPASMILQIDKVVTQETTASPSKQDAFTSAPRFYLTDGQLCVQALLKPRLLAVGDFKPGDLLDIHNFAVRKAKRLNDSGKVIYLGIEELQILSRDKYEDLGEEGGFIKADEVDAPATPPTKRRKLNPSRVTFTDVPEGTEVSGEPMEVANNEEGKVAARNSQSEVEAETDSEDDFESANLDLSVVQQRRKALQRLQNSSACEEDDRNLGPRREPTVKRSTEEPQQDLPATTTTAQPSLQPPSTTKDAISQATLPSLPVHRPLPITPPYHTLASLLNPQLPTKNYALTTLAVISYISPSLLSRSNSPFPPKRHIKLVDPSLSTSANLYPQGFTLAVYINAASFQPLPGTIALFRGIVMQKFNSEVILNAYASIKDKLEGEKWFVDDENVLEGLGFDIKGMKRWWDERVRRNISSKQRPGSR